MALYKAKAKIGPRRACPGRSKMNNYSLRAFQKTNLKNEMELKLSFGIVNLKKEKKFFSISFQASNFCFRQAWVYNRQGRSEK